MRHGTYVIVGLLVTAAACSASGGGNEPEPNAGPAETDSNADSGASIVDAAVLEDAAPEPEAELDAGRPLVCGDAGFCETQLPRSDLGLPLSLRSVWVAGPKDVWSVSIEGFVLHNDGTRWTTEYRVNHELYAVWATSTGVWVGGEMGLLLHRSAAGEWSFVETGHLQPIRGIYGTGDDDVWFTRDDDAVDHYDGSTLKRYPLDVLGLRITTVFGRPGFGTYAAGYVPGPIVQKVRQDQPYMFELSTTGVSNFNALLTTKRGFVPHSGYVTDAPDEGQRILLTGYSFSNQPISASQVLDVYTFNCSFLGRDTSVSIDTLDPYGVTVDKLDGGARFDEIRPSYPMLVYGWNDIWFLWSPGYIRRWIGTGFETVGYSSTKIYSLAMGNVPPAAIFGAHSSPTDAWIVGDGFALRRAIQ